MCTVHVYKHTAETTLPEKKARSSFYPLYDYYDQYAHCDHCAHYDRYDRERPGSGSGSVNLSPEYGSAVRRLNVP